MTTYTLANYDQALSFVDALTKAGFSAKGRVSLAAPQMFRHEGPVVVETGAPAWFYGRALALGIKFVPNKKPWEK